MMKRTKRILAALLALLLLSACAETPSSDIVSGKEEATLKEKINISAAENVEFRVTSIPSFYSSDDRVLFDFEGAEYCVPNAGIIPVFLVTPHFWSSADVEQIARVLCGDTPVYAYSDRLTKQQLEAQILELRQWMASDAFVQQCNGDQAKLDKELEACESRIAQLEEQYEQAENDTDKTLSDFAFRPDTDWYSETSFFSGTGEVEAMMATAEINGAPFLFHVTKRDDDAYRLSNFAFYIFDFNNGVYDEHAFCQTAPFSERDIQAATEEIQEKLQRMQIGQWQLYDAAQIVAAGQQNEDGSIPYVLKTIWQRTIDGFPASVVPQLSLSREETVSDYSPKYYYETLEIGYSNGMIVSFEYWGPLDVTETLNSSVKVLDWAEVEEIICRQLKTHYTYDGLLGKTYASMASSASEQTKGLVSIARIELGLVRVQVGGNSDSFYLLPAWTVYGWTELNDNLSIGSQTENEKHVPDVLLCINAIDGSVIDLSKGY